MPWQVPLFLEHEERSIVFNPVAVPASNVTDTNCSTGVQFIYKVLGDCVTDTKGILSDAFGIASIAFWIIVSVPQMVKNCRNIQGVEGVSLGLILQWTLGDTTNLVGSILTKQLILQNFRDEVGYAIGVVSSIFYIGSRSSQLYKNYKRKSTEGLSLLMFWLAILGNLTYGLSILVRQLDAVFVIRHIPWLVGSLGVILLDASLVIQFKYYGSTDTIEEISRRPLLESEVDVENDVPNYHSVNSVDGYTSSYS
ncbi:hypothetical protein FSP39_003011 [Pinctada imbricata]|uniref:Uncharacterized protein n=1 Tax=Pinctada imbricata TaxID=66713 RepID=A0AA88YS54_PINIB|nr:hypothetical protein FSP39_003011 [Pinctada imbricata]